MKLFCQMASFALTLLLSGCLKHGLIPPGNTIDNCHITSMTFVNAEFNLTDTLTFYYNPDGTPSHIDRAFVDDGSPKYIFRYDGQGRLLDYIGALDNGAAEFWTRYYYNEAARTVLDTTYTDARQYLTWPPEFNGDALTEVRRFDELGRIIRYQHFFLTNIDGADTALPLFSQNFVYNRQGNVEGFTYDDKIDFHRTNHVWQFIDNDYSNNNALPIQQYNAYGLPTEVNFNIPTNEVGPSVFLGLNYPDFTIHYSCDAPERK